VKIKKKLIVLNLKFIQPFFISDIKTESHSSEETMKADKLPKSTDFMMNAWENTEMPMSGNILQTFLITFLSQL
jgi:hypothetical protein